jgi:hypothetical protein
MGIGPALRVVASMSREDWAVLEHEVPSPLEICEQRDQMEEQGKEARDDRGRTRRVRRAGRCRVLGLGMKSKREGGGTWASCEDPLPDSSFFLFIYYFKFFFLSLFYV